MGKYPNTKEEKLFLKFLHNAFTHQGVSVIKLDGRVSRPKSLPQKRNRYLRQHPRKARN